MDRFSKALCHAGAIHCIEMDPVGSCSDEIDDLTCHIVESGIKKGLGIVLVAIHDPPEPGGDGGSAEGGHPLKLG